jgi:hypothetical protein
MSGRAGLAPGGWACLALFFLGAALVVYRPALGGPFLSDDLHYVANNRWIQELSPGNLAALLDPGGAPTLAIVNWAPAQLLVHALAWRAFGSDTRGHHVLNVALHALASLLLAALFLATGVPRGAAVAGGALFLLHPANVEAVAWISQLKSTLALALTLAALLLWRRHPGLASAGFALALLAKATAACALPVAALLDWTRAGRVRWRWLALWALALALYAAAEFATHQRSGAAESSLHQEPLVLARTAIALAARYLVMAATSFGVSAFHEPEPARSWLDPWWLGGAAALLLLGWRAAIALRRRDVEVAWWAFAAASFAPVSQVFPFLYPMADRYLYFILPGLLGGALLAGREGLARLAPGPERRRALERGALAGALALCALFAWRSAGRAELWTSNARLVADAAVHYPQGKVGLVQEAKRAALVGDASGAVAALRRARGRGYNRFEQLAADPGWNAVRDDPAFRALLREMAGDWIARARAKRVLTQPELRMVAQAHVARGEVEAAAAALRQALELGGPYGEEIRADLAAIDAALASGARERLRLGAP